MSQLLPPPRQLQPHNELNNASIIALNVIAGQTPLLKKLIQNEGISPQRQDKEMPRLGQGFNPAQNFTFVLHGG